MKKQFFTAVLMGMMSASVALAIPTSGTIQGVQNTSSYSDGGQFTAWVNGELSTSFQTFCVEIFNEFSPGSSYFYTLGQTTHNNPPGASPLTLGTAWLFSQYASGAFGGTDIGGQYFLTPAKSGELQAALWYFQSQGANPNGAFNVWGNGLPTFDSYTDMALAALGGNANAFTPSAGAYGVSVIEEVNGQDWLEVPDGGLTVMLLGMALGSLTLVSRKIRQ